MLYIMQANTDVSKKKYKDQVNIIYTILQILVLLFVSRIIGYSLCLTGIFYYNVVPHQLMLSEWLLEVPDMFETEWLMVPCPIGRRNLVIASGVNEYLI